MAIAVSQDKREACCGQLLYLARVWWKYGQKEEYSTCYIMVEIRTEGRVQYVLYHGGNTDRRKSTVRAISWWKYGQKEEYSTCYIMVEIRTEGRVQYVLYQIISNTFLLFINVRSIKMNIFL